MSFTVAMHDDYVLSGGYCMGQVLQKTGTQWRWHQDHVLELTVREVIFEDTFLDALDAYGIDIGELKPRETFSPRAWQKLCVRVSG